VSSKSISVQLGPQVKWALKLIKVNETYTQ